jgi:hypothetical protein
MRVQNRLVFSVAGLAIVLALLVSLYPRELSFSSQDMIRTVAIPANCDIMTCRIGFNITVTHPETLDMTYTSKYATYAELDVLAKSGWPDAGHSPPVLNGSIVLYDICTSGTYRYWFSGGPYSNAYNVTVNVTPQPINHQCG